MKNSIAFYNSKLDSSPYGMLFNRIKFPDTNPILLISTLSVFGLLLSLLTGGILIFSIMIFVILLEYHSVRSFRIKVLDVCLVGEIMLEDDFKINGADPEFPNDPNYVTESDREYLFSDAIYQTSPTRIVDTLKSHHILMLNVMASFIFCYMLISNYIA
jgi:hypothetical protein